MLSGRTDFLRESTCHTTHLLHLLPFHNLSTSTFKAVCTLQLLHQLNIVLLGGGRSDLFFDSDFLPSVVLVLLLCTTATLTKNISCMNSSRFKEKRRRKHGPGRRNCRAVRLWRSLHQCLACNLRRAGSDQTVSVCQFRSYRSTQ